MPKRRNKVGKAQADVLDNYCDSPEYTQSLVPFLTYMLARHAQHGGVTEVRIILDNPFKSVRTRYFGGMS